jgi:hypothetical protein
MALNKNNIKHKFIEYEDAGQNDIKKSVKNQNHIYQNDILSKALQRMIFIRMTLLRKTVKQMCIKFWLKHNTENEYIYGTTNLFFT